jgi:hypothetical protein
MDKISTIFSIVTHDYKLMFWFWFLVTLPIMFWSSIKLRTQIPLNEKQLAEKSPKFDGIDSQFLTYTIVFVVLYVLPLWVFFPIVNKWSAQKFGIGFYPASVFIIFGFGNYESLFALVKGVYPLNKAMKYIYGDETRIRHLAKKQILASVFAIVFVVLFFFVTV